MEEQMTTRPSWASVRGPLAALWLSLLSVGWDMRSAIHIVSDTGQIFSLLEFAPKDVSELQLRGIRRWQAKRGQLHIREEGEGRCVDQGWWPWAIYKALHIVDRDMQPAELGAL